jgi:23S rRNA (guanosine2251-2'-O)-methyltransferase
MLLPRPAFNSKMVRMAPAGYGSRVEGFHAVAAAVAAGRVNRLWVESRRLRRPEVAAVVSQLDQRRVTEVPDVGSHADTEAPQGLVAGCDPILPVPLDSLAGVGSAVLALDHVEDPHNVGAIARSAAAAGMGGLVMSRHRASPLSAAAFKAAAGALEHLAVAVVGSIPEALSRLKEGGLWVVGLEAGGEQSLFGLELLTEPVVVVIGGEGRGLSTLVRKRCDVLAAIPMAPGIESLNASVSAALAGFEIMRIRRQALNPLAGH